MMEAVRTSETSVDNHFTWQYNPEDSSEHQGCVYANGIAVLAEGLGILSLGANATSGMNNTSRNLSFTKITFLVDVWELNPERMGSLWLKPLQLGGGGGSFARRGLRLWRREPCPFFFVLNRTKWNLIRYWNLVAYC
jgi:hypothetical protein